MHENYTRILQQEIEDLGIAESKSLVKMQEERRDIRLIKDWKREWKLHGHVKLSGVDWP